MNKIRRIALACLMCAILLTGCSSSVDADTNTVYVDKNGKVTSVDIETLDQDYYDETELREFLDEEVEAYNEEHGSGLVKIDELVVSGDTATLKVQYKTAEDYTGITGIEMYQGKVIQARAEGYDFDTSFVKVENGVAVGSVSREEVYAQDDLKVVIIRAKNMDVKVEGEILYVSGEDVELAGSDTISIKKGSWLGEKPAVESVEATESLMDASTETAAEDAASTEIVAEISIDEEVVDDGSFETDVYTYIIYK